MTKNNQQNFNGIELEQEKKNLMNSNNGVVQGSVQKQFKPLANFADGFKENYTDSFKPQNFKWDNQKTFGNYLGESLGTATKFIDSPLGRGLISAGLSAALGGNANTVAREGLKGFSGRQNAYTADKLYRKRLNEMGVDTNGIYGNIDQHTYNSLANSQLKQQQMMLRHSIANAKDDTQRVRLTMQAYNNGIIDENTAKGLMSLYNVNVNNLYPSNQTRNTNSLINHRNNQTAQRNRSLGQTARSLDIREKQARGEYRYR